MAGRRLARDLSVRRRSPSVRSSSGSRGCRRGGSALPPWLRNSADCRASSRRPHGCRCATCNWCRAACGHLLPGAVRAIQPDGVGGLDLDGAVAAPASHQQQMARNLRQPAALDRHAPSAAARIAQHGVPLGFGQGIGQPRRRRRGLRRPGGLGGKFVHLFRCWHAPLRGAVGHASNSSETTTKSRVRICVSRRRIRRQLSPAVFLKIEPSGTSLRSIPKRCP